MSLLIVCASQIGCLSLKIQPPMPEDSRFVKMTICSGIKNEKNQYIPTGITSEFSSKTERIICLIQLNEVSKEIHVLWKWYNPDGLIIRDTAQSGMLVNYKAEFIPVQTLYDELNLLKMGREIKPGQWTVAFFLNDRLAASQSFTIVKSKKNLFKFE